MMVAGLSLSNFTNPESESVSEIGTRTSAIGEIGKLGRASELKKRRSVETPYLLLGTI